MRLNFRVKHFVIPSWLIALLLISGVGMVVLAQYLSLSVNIPVEVKEPLEILNYSPSEISLFPGENESISVTVMNHAPVNYSVLLGFQLNDTIYQRFVEFSRETYLVVPGQQDLIGWLMVDPRAPAAYLSLTVNVVRSYQIPMGALLFEDFEDGNLNAWSGDKTYFSCSSEHPHEGTYSLKGWVASGNYAFSQIYRDFTPTQNITIVYWDRWHNLNGGNQFQLYGTSGHISVWLCVRQGKLAHLLSSPPENWLTVPDFSPSADIYYKITVVVNGKSKTFDLYIDDVQKLNDTPWFDVSSGNPSRIACGVQRGSMLSQYYRDDITVSETV